MILCNRPPYDPRPIPCPSAIPMPGPTMPFPAKPGPGTPFPGPYGPGPLGQPGIPRLPR
jgi:hypothetical protein